MEIEWTGPAIADMAGLRRDIARRVQLTVERFAASGSGDVKRLRGIEPPEFRLRVGDYRVRFRLRLDLLIVLRVRHRREAYR